MEKLLIKNVQNFCNLSQSLSGEISLKPEDWVGEREQSDVRFQYEKLNIIFSFTGNLYQGNNVIHGNWHAEVPVKCVKCNEKITLTLKEEYKNIILVDSRKKQQECLDEIIECWPINFDLLPWVVSEIILQIPIAPQHKEQDQCLKQHNEKKENILKANSFSNILKHYANNS
jgi:uncharacterized metal-binding protein YceD (DUF177 family)